MIKRIVHTISNFLFIILLILLAISFYSWFQVKIMNKPYSSFLGYSIFEVVTGSMSGTIEVNDYIVVKNTKDIKLMDIITFKDKDSLVTHRVVQIIGSSYVTKGDANNSEDVTISKDDIVGKVIFRIPSGAIWKKVFMDKNVLLVLTITLMIFTLYFSIDEKSELKQNKEINLTQEEIKEVKQEEIPKEEKPAKTQKKKKTNNHYPGKREYYKNKKRKQNNENK